MRILPFCLSASLCAPTLGQPVPKTPEETAAQMSALLDEYQRPGATGANGWSALIDVVRAMRTLDGSETYRFDLIFGKPGENPQEMDRALRQLGEYGKAGVFEKTKALTSAMRAKRAPQGSKEFTDALTTCGANVADGKDTRLLMLLLPELGKARQIARMQTARMHLAIEKKDEATAIAAFAEMLALGRILSHQHTMIDHLVANAIVSLAVERAACTVSSGKATPTLLKGWSDAMDAQLPLAPQELALKGERLAYMDTLRWTLGDGDLDAKEVEELKALSGGENPFNPASLAGAKKPSVESAAKAGDEFYSGLVNLARAPRYSRKAVGFDPDAYIKNLSAEQMVLQVTAPVTLKFLNARDQMDVKIATLRAAIELEKARQSSKVYPISLAALPEPVQRLIRDPYRDGLLGYKLTNIRGKTPSEAYILYTVGFDAEDNGGKEAKERFAPLNDKPEGKGFDHITLGPDTCKPN